MTYECASCNAVLPGMGDAIINAGELANLRARIFVLETELAQARMPVMGIAINSAPETEVKP